MVKHLVDGFKYYIYILQYVDLYCQYTFFFFKYLQIIGFFISFWPNFPWRSLDVPWVFHGFPQLFSRTRWMPISGPDASAALSSLECTWSKPNRCCPSETGQIWEIQWVSSGQLNENNWIKEIGWNWKFNDWINGSINPRHQGKSMKMIGKFGWPILEIGWNWMIWINIWLATTRKPLQWPSDQNLRSPGGLKFWPAKW